MDRTSDWRKQVWFVKVGFADAFASIRQADIWRTLKQRIGTAAAAAMMKLMDGHSLEPLWMRIPGEKVPLWKGRRQGAPDCPALRKPLVAEVVGLLIRTLVRRLTVGNQGQPPSWVTAPDGSSMWHTPMISVWTLEARQKSESCITPCKPTPEPTGSP